MVAMVTVHVLVQMFDILRPDCNGVLTVDELHKLPIDRFKAADRFIENSLGIVENIDEATDGSNKEHDETRCVDYTIHNICYYNVTNNKETH